MTEEGKITMTEFKTVVERFEENQKKIVEVMNHRFDRVEADIQIIKHEVALLHEGQTEIKHELRRKADAEDLAKLDMRVTRLENKVA